MVYEDYNREEIITMLNQIREYPDKLQPEEDTFVVNMTIRITCNQRLTGEERDLIIKLHNGVYEQE